ncbi:hypothetical protein POX_g09133 [Penicillium oxalicum]|uniref:hypothetical protein n=1 Tax=Penicillium oxalicum TaxID=69781 RepID=UPI0020B74AF8|nr:hypothetical protein POX_g09133 [Penicillium oxalicum]KAI2786741.1 hypothetical protein POX_g09133 [Penicillium oxalicum]
MSMFGCRGGESSIYLLTVLTPRISYSTNYILYQIPKISYRSLSLQRLRTYQEGSSTLEHPPLLERVHQRDWFRLFPPQEESGCLNGIGLLHLERVSTIPGL